VDASADSGLLLCDRPIIRLPILPIADRLNHRTIPHPSVHLCTTAHNAKIYTKTH